jgi:hypothetical protein
MDKIKLKFLKRTCYACPSQWEGEDINHRYVYIRYRWGTLRADHLKHFNTIYSKLIDESGWGGVMGNDEMMEYLKDVFDFSSITIDDLTVKNDSTI